MCPGNKIGGQRAAATNKEKYGDDFYRKIASIGGRRTGKKGFALNPELAKRAGAIGGKKSRRTGVITGQGKKREYYYDGDGKFKQEEPNPEPKKSFVKKIFGGK